MNETPNPEALLGVALAPTVYDVKERRSRCSQCRRFVITGQAACVCGAVFSATIQT